MPTCTPTLAKRIELKAEKVKTSKPRHPVYVTEKSPLASDPNAPSYQNNVGDWLDKGVCWAWGVGRFALGLLLTPWNEVEGKSSKHVEDFLENRVAPIGDTPSVRSGQLDCGEWSWPGRLPPSLGFGPHFYLPASGASSVDLPLPTKHLQRIR